MNTAQETSVISASARSTQSMGSLNKDQGKAGEPLRMPHDDQKEPSFSTVFEGARKSHGQHKETHAAAQEPEIPAPSDEISIDTSSAKEQNRINASDASDKQGAHAAPSSQNADLSSSKANEAPDPVIAAEPDISVIDKSAHVVPTATTEHNSGPKPVKTATAFPNGTEDDQPRRLADSQPPTSDADGVKHSDDTDDALMKRPATPSISEMAVAARQTLVTSSEQNGDRSQIPTHSSVPFDAKVVTQSIHSSEAITDHGGQSEGLPFARPAEAKHLGKGTEENFEPRTSRPEVNGNPSAHLATGDGRDPVDMGAGSSQGTPAASHGPAAQSQGGTLHPGLPAATPLITPQASRKTIENVEARSVRGSGPPVRPIASTTVRVAPTTTAIQASAVAVPISSFQPAGAPEASGATLLVASEPLQDIVWDQARTATLQGVQTGTPTRGEQSAMVMRQITDAIPSATQRPVEIALSPEELGRVRISVISEDRSVTVQILAERPETLDLMRKHIDQLGNSFREMGYESISFAFGQGSQSDDPSSDDNDRNTNSRVDGPTEAEPSQAVVAVTVEAAATAGLDLRL